MKLQHNIWKLAIVKASKWLMLIMPIIWLFYEDNGLTITDLFLIQSIYSLTIALIEIPSGYVADILGRRHAIILGTFFAVVGMSIYSISSDFELFLIAALSLGIGQSFISGSDTALMYDSLVELGRDKEFVKLEGRIVSVGNISEALAFIIGGLLAEISLRTPFYAQVIVALIGFLTALTIVEPTVHKPINNNTGTEARRASFDDIKNIIHYSLVKHIILRHYIIFSAVIGTATLAMAWFSQPLFMSIGIVSAFHFGLIGAALNTVVAVVSFYAHKIETIIDTNILLVAILLFVCGCYLLLGIKNMQWALAILVIFYLIRGVATPVLRDYVNRYTPSSMRATVMSIRSFITRVIFAVLSPFLGAIAEAYSVQQALFIAGFIFFFCCLWSIIFLLAFKQGKIPSQEPAGY